MKKILLTLAITLAVMIGLALAIIYTGIYDVSAANPEGSLTRWVLSTTMDNSVRHHAGGVVVPSLDDSALVGLGFDHYNEMCVTCHGSPTSRRSEAGRGLNPPAPDLSEAAGDWTPAELYWIIKNGIKMSGMPAFGQTHDERELWGMVAFVRKLPGMSQERYRAFSTEAGQKGASADGHTY